MPSQLPAISKFGQALSIEMREQKISAGKLAFATGISERLIRKYKSGETIPWDCWHDPTENAHKIAEALGVDLAVMFGADEVAA